MCVDLTHTHTHARTTQGNTETDTHLSLPRSRFDLDSDIALLELNATLTFNDHVTPICSPDPTNNYESGMSTVAGWGTLSSGGCEYCVCVCVRCTHT